MDRRTSETALEPALPIVDAHHHLWMVPQAAATQTQEQPTTFEKELLPIFQRHPRYLIDEYLADVGSGHNIKATVFVEAKTMYRADGPDKFRSVGEVEFVNGVAAMSASGLFGPARLCAAIVGGVDLRLGRAAQEVLAAHIQAGGGRYRGVRSPVVHDDDPSILGTWTMPPVRAGILLDREFRAGFALLAPLGLSFDAYVFDPQLPELIDLARAFPDTRIILNHIGGPLGVGRYAGHRESRFSVWNAHIRTLAKCENVTVKLGGLEIPFVGFKEDYGPAPAGSSALTARWRPYVEACITAFGPARCMFESNFPIDSAAVSYSTLWNAFKMLTRELSQDERRRLFSGTAIDTYRIEI